MFPYDATLTEVTLHGSTSQQVSGETNKGTSTSVSIERLMADNVWHVMFSQTPPGFAHSLCSARVLIAVERGDYFELHGDRELKDFFADIIARGKKRFARAKHDRDRA